MKTYLVESDGLFIGEMIRGQISQVMGKVVGVVSQESQVGPIFPERESDRQEP